jgi:hypothetical protein
MAILSYEGGFLTNEELSYKLNASQGQKKQGELKRQDNTYGRQWRYRPKDREAVGLDRSTVRRFRQVYSLWN